jgi:hypothetical protein
MARVARSCRGRALGRSHRASLERHAARPNLPSAQLYDSGGAIKALAWGARDPSVQASPTLSLIEPNLAVIALLMFFGATREAGGKQRAAVAQASTYQGVRMNWARRL